ncbi:MAG: ROK family protein [Anaerolineaceae bacterium]|nr:ROK family protein [Anaerolineaceae bacterium]
MKHFIGCDLGGTNIKAGLVDVERGQVLLSHSIPTLAREGHAAVIKRIANVVESLISETKMSKSDIGGMGVTAPGRLDLIKGETIFLPNMPGQWRNIPLKTNLENLMELPVVLLNDVRAITYGEWAFGAGKGVDDMACFAIGTGIGGGLIVNKQLLLSNGGTAGEFGHLTIDIHGPLCGCGNKGCLESYASGPAITTMGVRAVEQGWTTLITELCENDLNRIDTKLIADAALNGDKVAKDIWETAGYYLGIGVANVIITTGPSRIVISGGVSAAGELLLAPIRRVIKERVFVVPTEHIAIVLGQLGNDAGILGMAGWAANS